MNSATSSSSSSAVPLVCALLLSLLLHLVLLLVVGWRLPPVAVAPPAAPVVLTLLPPIEPVVATESTSAITAPATPVPPPAPTIPKSAKRVQHPPPPVSVRSTPPTTVAPALAPRSRPPFDTSDLFAQARSIARQHEETLPQNTTRQLRIDSGTRDPQLRSYGDAWRLKVERIGNMNYPLDGLSGSLVLAADIAADGSLRSVSVVRSSGILALDQAAQHIVELAAPFSPLPPALTHQADEVTIIRTWTFSRDARFSSN